MRSCVTYAVLAVAMSASLTLAGCEQVPEGNSKAKEAATPSVGREYGETLHGAIDQAQGVRNTLERSNKALDLGDDAEE